MKEYDKKEPGYYEKMRKEFIKKTSNRGEPGKISHSEFSELVAHLRKRTLGINFYDIIKILNNRKIDRIRMEQIYGTAKNKKARELALEILSSGDLAYIEYTGRR